MPARNFDAAMAFILDPQRDGHKHDSAPGEDFATSYGVTTFTWDAAVRDGIVDGALEDATLAQIEAIYRVRFWGACQCDALPNGLDLMLFEQATLAGVGRAVKIMQSIVGASVDGAVGPETLGKIARHDTKELIDKQHDAFLAFLAGLANWKTFRRGWSERELEAKAEAYQLAGISVT